MVFVGVVLNALTHLALEHSARERLSVRSVLEDRGWRRRRETTHPVHRDEGLRLVVLKKKAGGGEQRIVSGQFYATFLDVSTNRPSAMLTCSRRRGKREPRQHGSHASSSSPITERTEHAMERFKML